MSKEIHDLIEKLRNFKRHVRTIDIQNPPAKVSYNPHSKAIRTPLGDFPTQRAAAKAHGINDNTMYQWITTGKEGFSYKEIDNE